MKELDAIIAGEIERSGPMDFARFMELALYHPRSGYYSSGRVRSDWDGDFVTSPEVDPAFGGLWARGIEEIWRLCGSPGGFSVVEIGPGEGGFARGFLSAISGSDLEPSLRYILVERTPALRARQQERLVSLDVSWQQLETLEPFPAGVVFANEVLDNAPVHLLRKEGGELYELCVDVRGDSMEFIPVPAGEALVQAVGESADKIPEGGLYEVGLEATKLVRRAASLVGRGAVILVDYGAAAAALAERQDGTCICYSATGTDDKPLERPGEKDITTHVNWTYVAAALEGAGLVVSGPRSQRDVLRSLGSRSLDRKLQESFHGSSEVKDGAAALRALSRRQAIGALTDPGGLGALDVMTASKGISVPSFMTAGS